MVGGADAVEIPERVVEDDEDRGDGGEAGEDLSEEMRGALGDGEGGEVVEAGDPGRGGGGGEVVDAEVEGGGAGVRRVRGGREWGWSRGRSTRWRWGRWGRWC